MSVACHPAVSFSLITIITINMIVTIILVGFHSNMSRCAYACHDNMSMSMLAMMTVLVNVFNWLYTGRPGIDLSQEPPAVRMNDELGGILTYKLKVT